MDTPEIKKENVVELLNKRFVNVYDLQYAEGMHYFDATRRTIDDLTALKSEDEFLKLLPDAVTCIIIVRLPGEEPKLLFSYEYRYPTAHYLLSPPAGLIDPEDADGSDPLNTAAKREIFEETGITVKDTDRLFTVSPLLFSTPGMTDESNALMCAVVSLPDLDCLNQDGAVGTENFAGFELLTKEDAIKVLLSGRDKFGHFYSAYTWCALMYFVSGLWEE